MRIVFALTIVAIGLAGCAHGTVHCGNLAQGTCDASFTRLLTDTGVDLRIDPATKTLTLGYTSKPNQDGTKEAFGLASQAVGVADKAVGAIAKVP